ncbi:unnamed protein product [Effrenium voratum]|nr:unnamed protein product [Effrenium voratum]
MRAEWLRSGQEPAVIPLAIVVIASGSKASTSVQGRPVLETKGQISIVRFTEGRGQSAPFNSAEVIRQLCFSENSAMEVQGIYGFEDAGESECMICYARPKNVLLLPCRHCSVCHSCLRSLRDEKCPLCRSSFSSYLTCPSRLPILAALSLTAVLLCYCVGLELLVSQNLTVQKRLSIKLSPGALRLVLPVSIAVAAVVLCTAAAAELSTAGTVTNFCRGGPDSKVLELASETAGKTSSAYGLAEYYLTGKPDNPATAHLSLAQAAVSACISWLDEYRTALATTCPQWKAQEVYSDLQNLEENLNASGAVLQPSGLYPHYQTATHVAACVGGSSGLASLALEQVLLGAVLLPFLGLSTSWVLSFLSRGGVYQKLAQGKADASSDDEASKHEDLNSLYYVVYAFSAVIFAVGTWMYVVPQPGILRPVIGTLLFATGIFLMMNSDLIVTYFRLHEQVEKFKSNNDSYQKNVDKTAQEVRTLQTAAKGFEEIDRKFGSDIDRAMKEVRMMETAARSKMGMSIGRMVQLYMDVDQDKKISDKELDEAVNTLADIFGAMIKGLRAERLPKMIDAIRGHKIFRTTGSISLDSFAKAFEITLFVPEVKQISQSVKGVIDDAESRAAAKAARRGQSP